jgi:hypothetical protein
MDREYSTALQIQEACVRIGIPQAVLDTTRQRHRDSAASSLQYDS